MRDDCLYSVANEALTQVRTLARGLAPLSRARQDLPGALDALRQQVRRMHDVEVHVRLAPDCAGFDRETAAHLLRIVQEATANAIRHGEASRIDVSLRCCEGRHRLVIVDNGCGFEPRRPRRSEGSGLGLMEYRAALIGGSFKISSARQSGTRIEVSFTPTDPCPHENAC